MTHYALRIFPAHARPYQIHDLDQRKDGQSTWFAGYKTRIGAERALTKLQAAAAGNPGG